MTLGQHGNMQSRISRFLQVTNSGNSWPGRCRRTPECVVLDAKRTLRYRGRIDDQYRPGGQRDKPTRNDLAEALEVMLAGKEVAVATTPVDGCIITRMSDKSDKPVTYADHVAPILANHCQVCHQPNTAAPFALQTYEQAKARGKTIAEVVAEGRMPPWFAPPPLIAKNVTKPTRASARVKNPITTAGDVQAGRDSDSSASGRGSSASATMPTAATSTLSAKSRSKT